MMQDSLLSAIKVCWEHALAMELSLICFFLVKAL